MENLSQALAIIHQINSPWLRLYPDIGNLAGAGYSPPEEIKRAKDQILGIHVKDAMPKVIRGIPFEEGIVPFQETFHALAQSGFCGLLGVEIWGDRHASDDHIAAAAAARKFVDDLVAAETWVTELPTVNSPESLEP